MGCFGSSSCVVGERVEMEVERGVAGRDETRMAELGRGVDEHEGSRLRLNCGDDVEARSREQGRETCLGWPRSSLAGSLDHIHTLHFQLAQRDHRLPFLDGHRGRRGDHLSCGCAEPLLRLHSCSNPSEAAPAVGKPNLNGQMFLRTRIAR